MAEYMKEQLQQLEEQKVRAKETLEDIEKTISEIKLSTGYKIHVMLERNGLNGIQKIQPKHDGTHVVFKGNELNSEMLERFRRFKLERLYTESGSLVAVFE
ncbi:MAG: hypothetical protein NPMRTH1_330010 [Nitrosopumilales archaeon]|nr:MAG: hypothetical protein NPMRTH1_330010 [Nitrosopumilales archaeon]